VALLLLTAFATPTAPPINDPNAPNIGKIGNIPSRFAVGSTRFFAVFFFVFIPMPIFVLVFIAAQMAAATALSPRVEFRKRDNTFPRFLSEYFVGHVSFCEIVAMRIGYVVLATCRV